MNIDTGVCRIFRKTLGKCESYSAEGLRCNFISPVEIWEQRPAKHLKTLTFNATSKFLRLSEKYYGKEKLKRELKLTNMAWQFSARVGDFLFLRSKTILRHIKHTLNRKSTAITHIHILDILGGN